MEREIEGRCMKLLLHQQPVARDLRLISAALKMITDMERIGDQAEDIAEIVTFLKGRTVGEMNHISDMAAKTIEKLFISVYMKRCCFFSVKRTAAPEIISAATFKLCILTYRSYYVGCIENCIYCFIRNI